MSDIPYVDQLGDALERAIAVPAHGRRSRFRRPVLVVAVAAASLAVVAVAIAHFVASPGDLATRSIACYTSADLRSNITVVANDRAPVAACVAAYQGMGLAVPPLVACANEASVAVIPGAGSSACARAKLQPLPAGYAAAQAETARLAHAIEALEAKRDCVAPGELANEVQQVLERQGWGGWKAQVQSDRSGPCGTVSTLDGSGHWRIDGALDSSRHVVVVSQSAARSTMALLYGSDGLAPRLEEKSGSRCFTVAGLALLVDARARAVGRSATVQIDQPLANGVTIAGGRAERYDAGCAILTDLRPASDGRNFVAAIPKPRGR